MSDAAKHRMNHIDKNLSSLIVRVSDNDEKFQREFAELEMLREAVSGDLPQNKSIEYVSEESDQASKSEAKLEHHDIADANNDNNNNKKNNPYLESDEVVCRRSMFFVLACILASYVSFFYTEQQSLMFVLTSLALGSFYYSIEKSFLEVSQLISCNQRGNN